jgi:Fur family peroxide stress response transcriptional regulator
MARLTQQLVDKLVQEDRCKMTPQRRAIVEYLASAHDHPTADEVLSAVNRQFPMTSRATVYNTLNWLKDAKLISEVQEGGQVRFDPNTDRHHHFVCSRCGSVEDVEASAIGELHFAGVNGQQIDDFEVILRGICLDCQN